MKIAHKVKDKRYVDIEVAEVKKYCHNAMNAKVRAAVKENKWHVKWMNELKNDEKMKSEKMYKRCTR